MPEVPPDRIESGHGVSLKLPEPQAALLAGLTLEPGAAVAAAEFMAVVAGLIDVASNQRHEDGLLHAIKLLDQMPEVVQGEVSVALRRYFLANAHAGLAGLSHGDRETVWDWEQPNRALAILNYREALAASDIDKEPPVRRNQIETNLGNSLSHVGRFIRAIEHWDNVLTVEPGFGMAHANRAKALVSYSACLHEKHWRHCLVSEARLAIDEAFGCGLEPGADRSFEPLADWLTERTAGWAPYEPPTAFNGMSPEEASYRQWVVNNKLALNPLNDIWRVPEAARDSYHLPPLMLSFKEASGVLGQFNQLKQEYTTARWLLFEGTNSDEAHFADAGVRLIEPPDMAHFSMDDEKVRLAFRSAYSLMDRVAFFINRHWQLGWSSDRVWLKSLWCPRGKKGGPAPGLRPEFQRGPNWPLRGIYWISKDLYDEELVGETTSPEARDLYFLRRALEHRDVRTYSFSLPSEELLPSDCECVIEEDLARETLRMLGLGREVLLHLGMATGIEERRREQVRPAEEPRVTMEVREVPFEFKRRF